MRKRSVRRQQQGWVMLVVLLILLALAMAVTGFYTQSEDMRFAGSSVSGYALASQRAEQGAQTALSLIRSGGFQVSTLTQVCNDAPPIDPYTACAGNMLSNPQFPNPETGPAGIDPRQGGGLLYRYIIYRPQLAGAPVNLYTIRSQGFFGITTTSTNLYTSEVEITVEVGASSGFNCKSYDCS